MLHRRRAMFSIAIVALMCAPAAASAQGNPVAYSYAALLDSAGNHYIPINEEMYPPMAKAGYLYFMDVLFNFTDKTTNTPVVVTVNANNPGVSFAGYKVRANGTNVPTAWLIKAELVASAGGAPRALAPATLGDKFYLGYDATRYTFNGISLAAPLPMTGGASLVKQSANFADLPDIAGGSMRADWARPLTVSAAVSPTTTTTTKPVAPTSIQGIKPTVPIIKK